MRFKVTATLGLLLVLLFGNLEASVKDVTIYGYHLKPPFIVDAKKEVGLYFDFSVYMNKKQQKYKFSTKYIPKKRIHNYIENDRLDGPLIGVNPLWYGDKAETKYLWTPKIFTDRDEIVSLTSSPFEFAGPTSLIDKKIGGVSGFYYWALNKIEKSDFYLQSVASEKSVLGVLLKQRVDIGIVSQSTLSYLVKHNKKYEGKFHISKNPHEEYDRRMLVALKHKELFDYMKPFMAEMYSDPDWKMYLNKYK